MARTRSRLSAGTVVFNCEGLVKWCQADLRVTSIVREAQNNDFRVVVSAIMPVEAQDVRVKADRLRWFLSRLWVEPVSEEIGMTAIDLLRAAGLYGHEYAIDAIGAATALRAVKPVIVLTSDEDGMTKLCGKSIRIVAV